MSIEQAALLAELPSPWRKDGALAPALLVTSGSAIRVVVAYPWVQVYSVATKAQLASIHLDDSDTLTTLSLALATYGWTAALQSDATAAMLAGCLIDQEVSGTSVALQRAASSTWRVVDPLARQLGAAVDRIDTALAQANLLDAAGDFARWWARWTGTATHDGEDDDTFTARQRREVIRHRDNLFALAELLEDDFGVTVTDIRNLLPLCFECSNTPMRNRPLRGWQYNATCLEVVVVGFPTVGLIAAAKLHVAAGVTVFVLGSYAVPLGAGGFTLAGAAATIGAPPAMQIGVGRIGVGKVGA